VFHFCQSGAEFYVETSQLAQVLVALGCPAEKSAEMAAQLDKRACQLAAEKNQPHEEALKYLITLMRQGWSAKEKGL
jgi:pyrroline-5-carboxylate reductase